MTLYLLAWHWHCTRTSFTVVVSRNDGIAVRSCPCLCLQRQVAKLASGLSYYWSLLPNNNTATNLQTFNLSWVVSIFQRVTKAAGFFHPELIFLVDLHV